jgi:hypothetical protein
MQSHFPSVLGFSMRMAPPTATPYITVTDDQGCIDFEPHRRYDNGHPKSPWRRAAIIPIWVVEVILLAFNAVITGMMIGITESESGPRKNHLQPYAHLLSEVLF